MEEGDDGVVGGAGRAGCGETKDGIDYHGRRGEEGGVACGEERSDELERMKER